MSQGTPSNTPNGQMPNVFIGPTGRAHYLNSEGHWTPFVLPQQHAVYPPGGGPNDPSVNAAHIGNHNPSQPMAGPSRIRGSAIDPALLPLPPQQPQEVAEIRGISPVEKVAGSRCPSRKIDLKGKGKARAKDDSAPSQKRKHSGRGLDDREEKMSKKGRAKGVPNYSEEEVSKLLDYVEDALPVGGKGWTVVGTHHRVWARKYGLSERSDRSLENKYKQLVKTTKPTGNAECPPAVERAHYIDDLINDKVGSCDLSDTEIADRYSSNEDSDTVISVSSDEDNKPPRPPKKKVRVAKVEQPLLPRRTRASAGAGLEVLNKLSANLDPSVQASRASDRMASSFQTTQIMALNQQIRDLHSDISTLRTQLSDAERRYHEAQRQADRAEQQVEFTRMLHQVTGSRSSGPSERPPLRLTPQRRYDIGYRDGGRSSYWGYPEDAPTFSSPPAFVRENVETPSQGHDHHREEDYHMHGSIVRSREPHTANHARTRTPPSSQPTFNLHRRSSGHLTNAMADIAGLSTHVRAVEVSLTPRRAHNDGFSIDVTPLSQHHTDRYSTPERPTTPSDWRPSPMSNIYRAS